MKKKNDVKTIEQKFQPGTLARHHRLHPYQIRYAGYICALSITPEMPTTRNLEIVSSSSPFDINQPFSPSS